jgi:hypothetical protein
VSAVEAGSLVDRAGRYTGYPPVRPHQPPHAAAPSRDTPPQRRA